ncbi:MAG: RdgB/HAM1 family non-canonical purine NTP pyrophosphatase [Chitinophagaceae bacterium]|nr:RdgB/HAM1 family non-canonical purine NTP pyrophosphatase [Chitinophagaceae bacterium]
MKLIFATNNAHKVAEINAVIKGDVQVISLEEAGINIDIPEPHDTLELNATEKSKTIYELTKMNCFSEDTGLEVLSLGGEPGIKSARYAGEGRSFEKNIEKLLHKLENVANRSARFRTVISLIIDGRETLFEGICEGQIIEEKRGTGGFGYDPVFVPNGADKTFGEMTLDEKGLYSHRRKATEKLVVFLSNMSPIFNSLSTSNEI